jgi:hypothetical protein
MIIKLPIIEENKIIISQFRLEKFVDYFILSLYENKNTNLIKIICFNKINGIQNFQLYLPLKITFFNDILFCIYFFNIIVISDFISKEDFFSELNAIIKNKYCYSFPKFIQIKNNNLQLWKIINNEYNQIIQVNNFNNFDNYLKHLWEFINLVLNACVFLIFDFPNYTNKTIKEYQKKYNIPKKIINITNCIKIIKFSIFLSNEYDILEHLKLKENTKIKNITFIYPNKKYFFQINQSNQSNYFLLKVDKIINSIISSNDIQIDFFNYSCFHYIPNITITNNNIFLSFFNLKNVYSLILSKYDKTIDIVQHDKFFSFFFYNQIKSELYFLLNKTIKNIEDIDMQILESNNYNHDFFKFIVTKYTKLENILNILKILFTKYNFPIKFNKFEIDFIFDNILYISLFNYKLLIYTNNKQYSDNKIFLINELNILIPNKVKLLYFNIIKIFYQIINKSNEYIYNIKFSHDNLYKNFIKIFFFENSITLNLLTQMINKEEIIKIQNNFKNNYLLIDIANCLNLNNILKKKNYLIIIIKNKSIYFQDKLNKIIFNDNYNNKIKNIIINPFEMLSYFNFENDFIEWINLFSYKINEIFNRQIDLTPDDINDLSKLIYYLYNITEQDFKDNYYNLFINQAIKNPKIILYNQRINIKIKEFFNIKSNINFGILAKHLTTNNINNSLVCYDPKNEIVILKNQLDIISKKYLKYKRKYKEIRDNITSLSLTKI